MQEKGIEPFRADARFESVRRLGTITALDLAVPDGGYLADVGPKLQAFFRGRNLLLRPLGNTIYVMPPYCVTAADLDEIYVGISDAADERWFEGGTSSDGRPLRTPVRRRLEGMRGAC